MKRLFRICICFVIALASISGPLGLGIPAHAADWGSVTVGLDGGGRWQAILENSQIRVRYGYFVQGTEQTAILDMIIKSVGEDQVGSDSGNNYLDASATRGLMTNATIKYDGPDRKTVSLEWDGGNEIQEVTIYPDSTYIQIDYVKYGVNIVELGTPGGTTNGTYEFY